MRHAHILLWVEPGDKLHLEGVDSAIFAEIPNLERDPELRDLVMKNMIHGPCGSGNPASPCMRDNQCSKQFPKPARAVTEQGQDSYPLYRRRIPDDGGETGHINIQQEGQTVLNVT